MKDHAVKGAEFTQKLLRDFPMSSQEVTDVCRAIKNHEAFKQDMEIDSPEGKLISDCLYDADKFRWGPDNFTDTLWEMVSYLNPPLETFLAHYPRGMQGLERIKQTFRSRTGRQYGPRFIDIGLAIGAKSCTGSYKKNSTPTNRRRSMDQPIEMYWKIKIDETRERLEANNFDVSVAAGISDARALVLEEIIPRLKPQSISWGGSMTFVASGLYQTLKNSDAMEIVDTFDKSTSEAEMLKRRRASLMVDLFITGTNAITEDGQLVNLDMIGNRVGGLTFGPRHVIVLAGSQQNRSGYRRCHGTHQNLCCARQCHASRQEDTLHQDRLLPRVSKPGSHLQHMDHHGKILSQAQDQHRADQCGCRSLN